MTTHSSPRRAKIICTIGPSSRSPEMMRALLLNGMDVARFNFSHGGPNLQSEHVETLRRVSRETGRPVALLQDLQGPKIRVGAIEGGMVELNEGRFFTLTTRPCAGDTDCVATTYPALPRDCRKGDRLLLDDGLISLQVEEVNESDVRCIVIDGGPLKSNKGINLPGVAVSAPALSEKDRHDVEWAIQNELDYVALSFVRRAEDVRELREIINRHNSRMQIIAKLEKPEAINDLEAIIREADGVMVARGDLGVEMSPEEVPLLQKQIINAANAQGKTVITATQMLESMTENMRPTRAEASDVANAVLDGTAALMLSGETAAGAYPLEALQMMARIVERVEATCEDEWHEMRRQERELKIAQNNFALATAEAAAHAAARLKAKAIACFTETGSSARLVARFRPPVPIIALTPHENIARQLQLVWGVRPVLVERNSDTDHMITHGDARLIESGIVMPGDIVVVTLGAPVSQHGSTNAMKLHRVGEMDLA
jgi:pyruvate kinase